MIMVWRRTAGDAHTNEVILRQLRLALRCVTRLHMRTPSAVLFSEEERK